MPNQTPKNIYEFVVHPWRTVEKQILALRDFDWNKLPQTAQYETLHTYAELLAGYVEHPPLADPSWKLDKAVIGLIDPARIEQFFHTPEDAAIVNDVLFQLKHTIAVTVTDGTEELYRVSRMEKIFLGQVAEYDTASFVYSLRQGLNADDLPAYRAMIIPYLQIEDIQRRKQFTWLEALIFILLLQMVWHRFRTLIDAEQEFLLQRYVYRSIVLGIPVRDAITDALYESPSWFDYVSLDDFYHRVIENNQERIPLSLTEEKEVLLPAVMKMYYAKAGDKDADPLMQNTFAKEIYQDMPGHGAFEVWLVEVLYIVTHLRHGSLIDQIAAAEPTELDLIDQDLVNLFQWFFDKKNWPKIATYFQTGKARFPVTVFLEKCMDIYELKTDGAVQKFLDFTEFLHREGVLESGEDIIEFHEKDAAFHWSPLVTG
ncbi:MAG TPA: hypothetical protein DCY48_03760 [Candidatus Magasanikbacteria bacterium]|nr:MAG: hypothetical protein A3I74_04515 [Candidatus Magasanikbacteria bacterium RIFCSPLOWO2_02_FULL_47_16]OGH79471.1 MAG: hypothetical protein A3C10_01485 [Candidatus Magasanikbacteria bacterium RIFCSPHIGHO2_02_FULL_48_18]OGH83369.1 MAG: hypothetical protein A3G08_04835 [Candidatus Magasanikbacteria bacterium RIFCSPLOWO2_12_FULL_47_9b]HAZ28861.1 hypothetical protein [Candidatus Magasanikbacteria bacterium]